LKIEIENEEALKDLDMLAKSGKGQTESLVE